MNFETLSVKNIELLRQFKVQALKERIKLYQLTEKVMNNYLNHKDKEHQYVLTDKLINLNNK